MKTEQPPPKRVQTCDRLFELHNTVNKEIGAAVQSIMRGKPIKPIAAECLRVIIREAAQLRVRIGKERNEK